MRARQAGATLVFELDGQLDFESTQQFQAACSDLIERNDAKQIVFNLQRLRFVGSSGINQFIQVLKEFNTSACRPRLCHVSSEFLRVFRAYQPARHPFEIFADEDEALASFLIDTTSIKKSSKRRLPA